MDSTTHKKDGAWPSKKAKPLNREAVDLAAQALGSAVKESAKQSVPWTMKELAGVVRKALGRTRLKSDLFLLVVNRSIELGLVQKKSREGGASVLVPADDPAMSAQKNPQRAREVLPKNEPHVPEEGAVPPTHPPSFPGACEKCNAKAEYCGHCSMPLWDDDIFVDSKGRWRCSACNDLNYKKSWGGLVRWDQHQKQSGEE